MRLLLLSALLLLSGLAQAATDAQRSEFLDALSAARHGNLANKQAEVADLQNYPLVDYLTAAQLRYRLGHDANSDVDVRVARFIADHPDLPPAKRLRGPWLASLARRQRWQAVIEHTRGGDSTTSQCRAVHARIELGDAPTNDALALYHAGHSQPKTCDPVFAWLDATGALPPDVVLERARLALLASHYGLVRYLARRLPATQSALAHQWLNVAVKPSNLAAAGPDLEDDVAVYAFKRWALRDVDSAADALARLVARFKLDDDDRYQMRRYVALLYAEDHRPEALLWFARINHKRMADDDHALGWEIRAAIYQQRWPLVLDATDDLSAQYANDAQWRYWKARALAATGHKDQARTIYSRLAAQRSYHGYLAADALGQDYQLNARPLDNDPGAKARVEARPALARARELRKLGMHYAANREWREVIAGLDQAALAQAARIAYQWRWYSRAIVTLAKAGYWDDLAIRYPTPFTADVEPAASRNNLDPAYILAIMRTESLFNPEAHSPAGAYGLMQLLPGTARLVARKLGQSAPATSLLDDPAVNIPLGAHYLRAMLDDWSDNLALATASYNAGPRKIAQWLPKQTMPADIWIANIPYTETRHYVQRVMAHMTVFQNHLHESIESLAKRLDAIKPRYPDDKQTTY